MLIWEFGFDITIILWSHLFQGPSFWGPPAVSELGGVSIWNIHKGVNLNCLDLRLLIAWKKFQTSSPK